MVLISYSGSSWPRVNTRTGEIFSTSSKMEHKTLEQSPSSGPRRLKSGRFLRFQ
uniref:F5/8 type C domain-containing protein n=1 Tax=Anguilla anguilla TaxID=7936 RepID=A0A0E9UYF4_ANGAN